MEFKEIAFNDKAMLAKEKSSIVSSKSSTVRKGWEKFFVPFAGDFLPFIEGTNIPS